MPARPTTRHDADKVERGWVVLYKGHEEVVRDVLRPDNDTVVLQMADGSDWPLVRAEPVYRVG